MASFTLSDDDSFIDLVWIEEPIPVSAEEQKASFKTLSEMKIFINSLFRTPKHMEEFEDQKVIITSNLWDPTHFAIEELDKYIPFDREVMETKGQQVKEFKKGELNIGKSKKKVKSRKQAIAIALSEAGISKKRKK